MVVSLSHGKLYSNDSAFIFFTGTGLKVHLNPEL